ncbi:uncharacterized protein LOC121736370 isoform X2 [Aricia agestis]|uniref:uncharacterized protein LOC121736370 isoform X2 n=1 Tax=Aricia agestis TaxID=91739 RepID=UPI001C2026AA|nr:uncharacterized protein LOC121736370 isoform X2 [Aricia agestis]
MPWNNSRNDFENALYDSQYPDENADGGVQLDHCRLYVTNLPKNLNEQGLTALFSKFGNIVKIHLSRDPTKRYAFVFFEAASQARVAMMKLNRTEPLKLNIAIAHKKNSQDQNENNNSRASRNFDRRSMADDYGSEGRSNNWNNSDCQNDVYEEELVDDELEMEEDLDLDVRLQMLNLKEAEIKLKKKILFLNQHKKMNQQSQQGNRSILPDGRIVVRNVGERAPVQENFSSAADDSKTPSSCEETTRGPRGQINEDKSNRKDSGEDDSTLKCCHDIDDGILQEITEAVFDEYCDIDIPLDIVVNHRNEVGCDESNICDIHRLRANDYEDVDGDLKFAITFAGYPKTKIQLHDIKRFNQCVKDIIGIQKSSKLLRNSPTFRDCYINNGAIVCVFNDFESKRWLLIILPGIKERMNCDFLLLKCETIRLWLTSIVTPAESSKFAEEFLQQLQKLNPDLKTGQWKIVKKINVSNVDYISIVIDKKSYEIIRSSTFRNVIDFNEMEFEIEGSIDIYGKTLSLEDDFWSIASRVEILKSLNAADTKFVKDNEKKLSKASDLHEMKDIKKKIDELYEINIDFKRNILKNPRINDYNEIIIDELKIVVALCGYPMSKINLRRMELFNKSLKDIIDMQKQSNLLKNTPKFLDCYINKGAIVCIFNDLDSKQWFVRVSPGLQERMNCRLKFFSTETTRLHLGKMKIQEGLCPAAVIDVFKNMQLFNPKIHKDNFKIISKQCINGKIHALYFLIDSISYETIRSFTFQNDVDSDKIQFRVKAGELVYYRVISFEPDLLSFQSRIKLLKDLKPDVFKVSDLKRNISTENYKPYECDESNDEDSSDEMHNSFTTKTAVRPRSEELITEDSSGELYTECAERRLQKELNSNSPNIKSDESGSLIEGEDILTNSSTEGISNLEEGFTDTFVKESNTLLNSSSESANQDSIIRDNVLCEIMASNILGVQKTSNEKLSEEFSKINANVNISNTWELRVRKSKSYDKENVNEINFETTNNINDSKTEDTDKFNDTEKIENFITVGDVKSEQSLKIVHQVINNGSSMDDSDSNENVTANEVSSTLINSVNESPNVLQIYISSDLKCENPEIDEVSTCDSIVLVKDENRSLPKQQTGNSNKIVDSSDLDRAMCDELDEHNEPEAIITSKLYVHKDFKNVDFTGDIEFKSAANINDNILFGDTDYSNRYRKKELSYYRCTNYLYVDKELKLAVVLEDYPTAKLDKSHMRQISRLFNECLTKDEELFDDDIIPQFEDVYISNGAIVFICENIETKEYFVEVLPEISTSLGLKLKLHNIARLIRFYRVSMTLPLEISQLESKAMLPTLQESYSKLQTNAWKIYSDVPGEQTRVFGVDGSSLRFLRKSNMTLEYEGHIVTCEEIKKPRPDNQPNVININTDTAEEIEKNLREKIIKMMYCELETSGKKTSLNNLRNKNRKNNYSDTIPDDFKLYISATEYPEVRIDEMNFNDIKQALEDLVGDTWGTYDAFIPRIYDIYLCEGVIFVICKDIQTRFWIESNINNIGLSLDFTIKATEYRGVVGIVNMKIKSIKSFEEVVAILQNQNPRLRTKFWRQTTTKTKYPQVVLQMDALSAQVIRSDSFNGNIDGQSPEFDFGYLLSIIKKRPSLEPFCSDDYKNITNDADIDVANNKENYKCDKCLNENDTFYYIGNENYNIMEQMDAIDDDDYCKVDLKIPPDFLTAKGCLDVIIGVLNEKNPKLNTFLWKIEPSSDVGHFTVFVDKTSARVMEEEDFDPSFAGENLEFQF